MRRCVSKGLSVLLFATLAIGCAGKEETTETTPDHQVAVIAEGEHGIATVSMNLEQMSRAADSIYRGVVIAAVPGSVKGGGGDIPVITYRLRVSETHKGSPAGSGAGLAEMTMIRPPTNSLGQPVLEGLPSLAVGKEYLLFAGAPSKLGLSSTIGLGQGLFLVHASGPGEVKLRNSLNNRGLFRGMSNQLQAEGPVSYALVRTELSNSLSNAALR